jgi:hypothetical protein
MSREICEVQNGAHRAIKLLDLIHSEDADMATQERAGVVNYPGFPPKVIDKCLLDDRNGLRPHHF